MVTKVPQILIENFQQAITDAVAAQLNFDIADYSTTVQMNTALADKADAAAVTTALAEKADTASVSAALADKADATALTALSSDLNDALNTAIPTAKELTADFVASGAIGAGKFVVLRSDGKVEEVTGTETALALGTPVQITSNTSAAILDARYNAATATVVILYRQTTSYRLIAGTVSGSTIIFGSELILGAAGANSVNAKIAWRSDGSKIFVMYCTSGASTMTCYVVTVSGTTLTPGTAQTISVPGGNANANLLVWDSVADRIVAVANQDYAFVMTVSGTTITFGTPQAFSMSASAWGWHYNETAARLVIWDTQATQTVRAATISGTTITLGMAATNPHLVVSGKQVGVSSSGELVVVGPLVSSGPYYVNAVTYSGSTVSFSAASKLSDLASNDANNVLIGYSPADNKFVVAQYETSVRSSNHEGSRFRVVSIVAGAPSLSAETVYEDVFNISVLAFAEDGTAIFIAGLTSGFGTEYQIAGRIIGDEFVVDADGTLKSAVPSLASAVWAMLPGSSQFINCYVNTQRYALVETARSFTGNAHKWFGVADAAAADGETVAIKLKGAIAGGQTGLTIGASYYLASDGTISANDNGRLAGVAVGATKLRLAA